jgi:UDP-N-acetylmuramoylalanine--D-glutamate ligase
MFPQKNVWITGNFDIPVSETLAQIVEQNKQSEDHVFVVECSSFMLYGLRDFVFDYGILLNIARDHLDWHKDFDEYQESKLTLLRRTSGAFFVPENSWNVLDDSLKNRGNKVDENFDLS